MGTELLYFLGRFHVLAVHLPIGIILVTVALKLLARRQAHARLRVALPFLWAASALTAILTVALGYLHYLEGGFAGSSATTHMVLGTGVAGTATVAWVLCARFEAVYARTGTGIAVALLALVTLTGHYGGNLTHGSTYLAEFAPGPIRSMAGLEPRRPPVTELAMADPYLDIVRPMLQARCWSCHNDDRRRAQLNLQTYQAMLDGGESGPVVIPGDAAASELFRRISLPPEHEDFMPADGKTPLTSIETEVIGWWIEQGVPTGSTLAALDTSGFQPLLERVLNLGAGTAVSTDSEPFVVDRAVLDSLAAAGFQARHRSMGDARLIVSLAHAPAGTMGDDHLQALVSVRDQVAELNLRQSGVQDIHLRQLVELSELERLSLPFNAVTDDGLAALIGLESLASLSLVGNPGVTDEGIMTLAGLHGLQRLYLWQTSVTESGIARLRERRPRLVVDLGIAVPTEAR